MKKLVLSSLAVMAVCGIANAKEFYGDVDHPVTPITISFADPIQLPFNNWKTYGLRFNLFVGNSFSVRGLDFGLVGMTASDFRGAAFGAANWVEGDMYGVQLAAIGNVVNGYTRGAQASAIINYNQSAFTGAQMSLINFNSAFMGLQFGLLDWNRGVCYGLEFGGVNVNTSWTSLKVDTGVTLTVGNGIDPAIIMLGVVNNLTGAGTIDFGTSEGMITASNSTGADPSAIRPKISGSGGVHQLDNHRSAHPSQRAALR